MKKMMICFCLGLLACTAAKAQDAVYKAELKRLTEVSGVYKTYDAMVPQLMNMLKMQFKARSIPEEALNKCEEEMKKEDVDYMMELLIPVYYKYYTLKDLKEIVAFYETPVGKKMCESNPKIVMETMQVIQPFAEKMSERFKNLLKAKGYTDI